MPAACKSLNLIHAIHYSSKICKRTDDSLCNDMEELMGKYFSTGLESKEFEGLYLPISISS